MVSTNEFVRDMMMAGEFNNLVWASNDLETVAHYYEGAVVELEVELDEDSGMPYVRSEAQLSVPLEEYTYGVAKMHYPVGADWYSFSGKYLKSHLVSIREIFPDLSPFVEEDE